MFLSTLRFLTYQATQKHLSSSLEPLGRYQSNLAESTTFLNQHRDIHVMN